MKTSRNQNSALINKECKIAKPVFSWVFIGNGDFSQTHREYDYRMYLDSVYISKSNQEIN